MEKRQRIGVDGQRQLKHVKDRIEQVEARIEEAKTRAELAESRTELAETRTELAETRAVLAETRAEQAESALQRVIQGVEGGGTAAQPLEGLGTTGSNDKVRPLAHLTSRQREILQHIAEGRNTKQIAHILNLSPKTVEYHRAKLMRAVDVYDIPGLVRLAVRAGLVPVES